MTTPTTSTDVRTAWAQRAEELADWALARVFVRTDRYGGYYRKGSGVEPCARPAKGPRADAVTRELVARHFRATQPDDVIGAYQLTPDPDCRGRAVMVDIDAHDDRADPARNERYAQHLYYHLKARGFRPLLATWGGGSFHLEAFFEHDVPGAVLYTFGRWLVSDAPAHGFTDPVESFPKQPNVPPGKYGNWLRLVGRHHTRDVWARVFDGTNWLDGAAAVAHVLSLAGDSPDLIPVEARPQPKCDSAPGPNGHPATDLPTDGHDVFAAYNRARTLDEVASWHEQKGHTVTRRTAERVDFTRSGKSAGESFNVKLIGGVPVTFNFSTNAGLPDHTGLSPAPVRCLYDTGACDTRAMNRFADVLRGEMGWGPRPSRNGTHPPTDPGGHPTGENSPDDELQLTEGGYTVHADGSTWHYVRQWDEEAQRYTITKRTKLANFSARIVGHTVRDDGAEQAHELTVCVSRDQTPDKTVTVPTGQFGALSWVIETCGPSYIICPGNGRHDHLRVAVQEMSARDLPTVTIFQHTGWREIGGRWRYLHAPPPGTAGAVGTVRTEEVQLTGAAAGFWLPPAPTGEELRRAVRASLALLDGLAPDAVAFPLLASVYRSVLGAPDYALWLCGQTGVHKSELAALAQQHFGPGMTRSRLPGNWASTDNALEGLAFTVKDAVLVIDDFAPSASRIDADRQRRVADRLIRGQGNHAGRQRMKADGSLRLPKPPRGLILATGEDEPTGQSIAARLCVVDVERGAVNLTRLSACQADAVAGHYAAAVAGFTAWLTPQYGEVLQRLDAERIAQRDKFVGRFPHARTPDLVANLLLGLLYLLDFAEHAGAISADEHERLWQRGQAAFLKVANGQKDRGAAFDPVVRFPSLFATLLTSGRAHVADRDGGEPKPPHESGWWGYELRDGRWYGRGRKIAWLDGDAVLLDPEAVYAELARLVTEQGQVFPVSAPTLWRRLKEARMLVRFDPERTTYRETVEGARRAVVVLAVPSLRETVPTVPPVPEE